ncbi:unnamed protein product, partial [Laminaria digitata]
FVSKQSVFSINRFLCKRRVDLFDPPPLPTRTRESPPARISRRSRPVTELPSRVAAGLWGPRGALPMKDALPEAEAGPLDDGQERQHRPSQAATSGLLVPPQPAGVAPQPPPPQQQLQPASLTPPSTPPIRSNSSTINSTGQRRSPTTQAAAAAAAPA